MSKGQRLLFALAAMSVTRAAAASGAAHPPVPSANAAPEAREGARAETHGRSWYGWQTLTLDAASLATFGMGAALVSAQGSSEALPPQILMWSGFAGAMLGSPSVHWGHGKVGRGFGSLGLRLAGLLLFAAAHPEGGGKSNTGLSALGLGVFGGAIVLDATSHGDIETDRSTARWSLSPMLGPRRGLLLACRL